ncbi:Gibberellin-regulated protein 4 [Zostera marina]|uniref:Gibberellin-regulated protein 4 n=1 Tax=Zostera marina TaxID=29655 RepID=A0A0K9PYW7_ZOSMR|nr:Gibberellin-regulated protein 4 [Zostera marina]
MTIAKSVLIVFALVAFTATFVRSKTIMEGYGEGSLRPEQCPSECDRRCSQTHHQKPCLQYCNQCCDKCLCVPPGFYGNKELCPCYNDWTTQEGGTKCP